MLGLCCCIEAFPILVSGGYSLLQCTGFSLRWLLWLQSMGSRHMGFSSCDSQAQLLYGMWDPPGPGIKLVSPALAGRFLTTGRGTREVLLSILFVPLSCCPSPSTSYSRLPTPQGFPPNHLRTHQTADFYSVVTCATKTLSLVPKGLVYSKTFLVPEERN